MLIISQTRVLDKRFKYKHFDKTGLIIYTIFRNE